MKNFLLFFSLVVMVSCTKHLETPEEYEPQIELTCKILDQYTDQMKVQITMDFIEKGSFKIENYGYAFSKNPNFDVAENQVFVGEYSGLLNPSKLSFFVSPELFPSDSIYYVKGFVTSNGLLFQSKIGTVNFHESNDAAPCSYEGEGYASATITSILNPGNTVSFGPLGDIRYTKTFAPGSGSPLVTSFSVPPTTGVYRTTNNYFLLRGQVKVERGNQYILPNQWLYVEQLNASQFKVTVCNIRWQFPSSTEYITGSWLINY